MPYIFESLSKRYGHIEGVRLENAAIGAVAFSQFHVDHGMPWVVALLLLSACASDKAPAEQAIKALNPDVNVVFTSSDFLFPSIVSALTQAGKYKKVGEDGQRLAHGFKPTPRLSAICVGVRKDFVSDRGGRFR